MKLQSQAAAKLFSIQSVVLLYKREFDEDLDFYKALESSGHVADICGSSAPKYFLFEGEVADYKLELPCNVKKIEHVSLPRPYNWYSGYCYNSLNDFALLNYRVDQSGNAGEYNPNATNINDLGPNANGMNSTYLINKNVFSAPLGPMVQFENENNCCLHFNFEKGKIHVLYSGPVVDEEGYPMLPSMTIRALAYYMKFLNQRVKYYKQIGSDAQMAFAKDEWITASSRARGPEALSANEIDNLLNTLTSFNRKKYNIPFRTV